MTILAETLHKGMLNQSSLDETSNKGKFADHSPTEVVQCNQLLLDTPGSQWLQVELVFNSDHKLWEQDHVAKST